LNLDYTRHIAKSKKSRWMTCINLSRDETLISKNRKPFNMMADEDNFYM